MGTKALIIVDMLNDFIDEKGTLYCGKTADAIVPEIKKRLDAARKRGDKIIYMTDSHDEDDVEFKRYPPHAVSGSWGARIVAELAPREGDAVIVKKTLNSFHGTDLEKVLTESGAKEVQVVGVCTSICVMDIVGDLAVRNYEIRVPVKAVADFDQEFHEFALKRMVRVYGASVS